MAESRLFLVLTATALSPWSLLFIVAIWDARGMTGWEFGSFAAPVLFLVAGLAASGVLKPRSRRAAP